MLVCFWFVGSFVSCIHTNNNTTFKASKTLKFCVDSFVFLVLCFWFLVSGFWFCVSGLQALKTLTFASFKDFKVLWFLVSDFWFLVSGCWFLDSGFWFVVSGFCFLVLRIQPSKLERL